MSAIFNQDYLKSICAEFSVQGQLFSCDAYGNGHINDTWRMAYSVNGTLRSYILQRVNHAIFKDVPALMENVMRVCQHMAGLELENGSVDGLKKSLVLVLTKTGSPYYKTTDGNFWRIYDFVENTLSVDILENETQAFQAAKSFGAFQRCLADLPGPRLNETIPNFHNTISRFAAFKAIVASDPAKRVASASSEIDFVCARENLSSSLLDLLKAGAIPERITHNDTKFNNVMLDLATGEAMCIVDLVFHLDKNQITSATYFVADRIDGRHALYFVTDPQVSVPMHFSACPHAPRQRYRRQKAAALGMAIKVQLALRRMG